MSADLELTRAPWRCKALQGGYSIDDDKGNVIAIVYREADARAIVTLPELLATCKLARASMSRFELSDILTKIDIAITKAEGSLK